MPTARKKTAKKKTAKRTAPKRARTLADRRKDAAAAKRKTAAKRKRRPRAANIAEPLALVRRSGPRPLSVTPGGLMAPQPATTRGVTTSPRARFSRACAAILGARLEPEEILIRPDGILYHSWITTEARFNAAFGFGGWRMVPVGKVQVEQEKYHDVIHQEWRLEVAYARHWDEVATANGKHKYRKDSNPTIDRGDAIKSAKSNAMKACGKDFAIGRELRLKPFQRRFRREMCVAVDVEKFKKDGDSWKKTIKVEWRLKDDDPLKNEIGPTSEDRALVQHARDDETIIDVTPLRAPQPTTPTVGPPSEDPAVAYVFVEERLVRDGTKDDQAWQLWTVTMRRADQPTGGELVELGYFTRTDDEVAGLRRVIAEQTPLTLDWETTENGNRINGYQPAE